MSTVHVTVEEIELEGDDGPDVPGLSLTCDKCGHEVEVYGTDDVSARRGAVMLREECPNGEHNFYVVN
jgi:hypothetical protein